MPYFVWFVRALGFWYCLTLVTGFSVFAWSCCEFFRKVPIRFRGFHGALVLLPILVSLLGAVDAGATKYQMVRDLGLDLTGYQIAFDIIPTAAGSLVWGIVVAFPAFVVLLIGWLLPRGGPSGHVSNS